MTLTASAIARNVREKTTSAAEVVKASLDAIARTEPKVRAYLEVFADRAMQDARAIDDRIAKGDGSSLPLAGVPIALKDNICLAWGKTTCGSRMLENYASPFSATAARKLTNAGAVIVGKTNLDEFGMGSTTENSAFGPTFNPWDVSRIPGGSSGGSAAAVATGTVTIALGSDTGGSIRQPASHCGVVGIKPTYGRVSRYGLVAYASSLDQIGVLASSVDDAALALSLIAGADESDSTSARRPDENFSKDLTTPIPHTVIGVPRQARSSANDPLVAAALEATINHFASRGAAIVDVDLPMTDHGIAAYYIVAPAEASSNLARFDGIRYGRRAELPQNGSLADLYTLSRAQGLGPEVKRRIMLGTHVLSSGYYDAYYTTALKVRRRIKADYDAAFSLAGCHAILMPAAPTPPFKLGDRSDPLAMYLEDVYTVGVNLAGLPAVTVPAASSASSSLPIGMQFIGPAWSESTLLRIARTLQPADGFPLARGL
jgi:aspartyl-tRNA(Asn)/glutamyl-tRNA(Gln) amidotransferase subunit A